MTKTKYELMESNFLNKVTLLEWNLNLKNIFNTNYGNPKIKYLTLNINYFNEHKFHLNQKLN